jgi:hypothetical protein
MIDDRDVESRVMNLKTEAQTVGAARADAGRRKVLL